MKNIDIIIKFLGREEGKTQHLKSETREINGKDITLLINYETIIALIDFDSLTIYLDNNRYSSTTSTIQNKLKRTIKEHCIDNFYNVKYFTNDIYNNVANKLLQDITTDNNEELKELKNKVQKSIRQMQSIINTSF